MQLKQQSSGTNHILQRPEQYQLSAEIVIQHKGAPWTCCNPARHSMMCQAHMLAVARQCMTSSEHEDVKQAQPMRTCREGHQWQNAY